MAELGTADLHSIPQPQILQSCKRCSATANLQVCGNFSHFCNCKCTLHFRKLRPHYLLLFCLRDNLFYFWSSNFAVNQTLTFKKKRSSTPGRLPPTQKIRASTSSKQFYRGTGNTAYCFADLW